jgi:AmmeMemoRadiSam system protein A
MYELAMKKASLYRKILETHTYFVYNGLKYRKIMHLTNDDKELLLSLARKAIEQAVNGQSPPEIPMHSEALDQPCGAFVTLTEKGELRGCIGYTEAVLPLIETVRDVAPRSALEDPRFASVEPGEIDNIAIEISALSPMRQISDINEIVVGTHGILMQQGYSKGLLLPQVATEYNWDLDTFLRQTARKAGLPYDAWKNPNTKIFIFSAEVFHEQKKNKRTP